MWNKISLFSLFLVAFMVNTGQGQEYVIRYQSLSSGTLFHVETKAGEKIGKVVRENNKDTILYSFLDPVDQLLAHGPTERHWTDTSVALTDSAGGKIGTFVAEIHNLYPTEYRVYTKENRLIAKGVMSLLGNSFSLADVNHPRRYFASFFRPMFKLFNDNWHFEIHEEGVIDLRVLSVIGAFQTACDLNFEMLEPKTTASRAVSSLLNPLPPLPSLQGRG